MRLRLLAPFGLATVGLVALLGFTVPISATTFTVLNTLDSGADSLRAAIVAANADGGGVPHSIEFAIPGAGPHTISLLTLLPAVSLETHIDGYTQPGATVNTSATATNADLRIILTVDVSVVAGLARGLDLLAADSRVSGLVFQAFDSEAIRIAGTADDTVIDGNFIGTNQAGTVSAAGAAPRDQDVGVVIASGATGVVIGGTALAARNLISGNGAVAVQIAGSSNFVQGNLIGTNAAGTAAIPNGMLNPPNVPAIQLVVASSNLIGGPTPAHRNVISGNAGDGFQLYAGSATNTIQGNYFGLDHSGTASLPNARHAIVFYDRGGAASAGNVVMDNVIANHPRKGIAIDGPNFTGTVVSGNLIGTAADGVTAMGNGFGVAPVGFGPDPAIDILFGAAATVAGNRLLYNSIGLLVRDCEPADCGGATAGSLLMGSTDNCLVFNDTGASNTTGVSNTFASNWWGAEDGPSGVGPGHGDSVSADIVFAPFLAAAPVGCPSYGEASGTKFTDLTGDGPSMDDTPLGGITINLWLDGGNGTFDDGGVDDTLDQTAVTDGVGDYAFFGLEPGETYFVEEDESTLPAGFVQTYGGVHQVDAAVDSVAADLDFGNAQGVDLSITKTAAPDAVSTGDQVVFTITVSNAGPGAAANVEVTDVLPAGFLFVSTTGCAEDPGGVPTCTLGTIPAMGSDGYTITTTATAPPGGSNMATVSSTSPELGPGDETAAATVTIEQTAIIEIPTLSTLGLGLLVLLIMAGGMMLVWRQH